MPFETIIAEGKIWSQTPQPRTVRDLLLLSERDASVAEQTLEVDPDWAFNIAYNAVLQTSRAFMVKQGYRPRGPDQRATVVGFIKEALGESFGEEVATFDQMRRKRHRAVYEAAGRIGKREAEQAVSFARNFVEKIRGLIGEST